MGNDVAVLLPPFRRVVSLVRRAGAQITTSRLLAVGCSAWEVTDRLPEEVGRVLVVEALGGGLGVFWGLLSSPRWGFNLQSES